jgi:hypothetical protein
LSERFSVCSRGIEDQVDGRLPLSAFNERSRVCIDASDDHDDGKVPVSWLPLTVNSCSTMEDHDGSSVPVS